MLVLPPFRGRDAIDTWSKRRCGEHAVLRSAEAKWNHSEHRHSHAARRLKLRGQRDVAHPREQRRIAPDKTNARPFPNHAARAVATHEIQSSQRIAPRGASHVHRDPVRLLPQVRDRVATPNLDAELSRAFLENRLGACLQDAEGIRVPAIETSQVERERSELDETYERCMLVFRSEALQEASVVEGLDASHVKAEGLREPRRLGEPLQHSDAHSPEPELARQHPARRSSACNDNVNVHWSLLLCNPAHCGPTRLDDGYARYSSVSTII